jgi:hypothetical protein
VGRIERRCMPEEEFILRGEKEVEVFGCLIRGLRE